MAIYAVLKGTKIPEVTGKEETREFPVKLAKPAQRALAGAGITTLKQAAKLSEEELSALHGIGQNAVQQIKKALAIKGYLLPIRKNKTTDNEFQFSDSCKS